MVAHLGLVPGGYAEQAVTTPDRLFPVPDHVDLADAVAMVGTGRTAQGILELEPPTSGDTVLVPAAAGGLGWLLVQAAHASGARVVAAARGADKLARLKELGPTSSSTTAMTTGRTRYAATVGGVSLVYDGVGGEVGRTCLELLSPGGRHVMFGYSAGSPTRFETADVVSRGISVSWSLGARMVALPGGIPGLAGRALERHAAGEWRPLVTTYPLADAARAHADLEDRATMGKVVLLSAIDPTGRLVRKPTRVAAKASGRGQERRRGTRKAIRAVVAGGDQNAVSAYRRRHRTGSRCTAARRLSPARRREPGRSRPRSSTDRSPGRMRLRRGPASGSQSR